VVSVVAAARVVNVINVSVINVSVINEGVLKSRPGLAGTLYIFQVLRVTMRSLPCPSRERLCIRYFPAVLF
jgi:hypothetical protein